VTVLWLAELDAEGLAAASAAALPLARSLAAGDEAGVMAVAFGPERVPAGLGAGVVSAVCRVSAPQLRGYAPAAWARTLQQLAEGRGASAVVAAATERGSEVMAHLGAMTGLPVAANCVSAVLDEAGRGRWRLVRQRWAGSVLEDAVLDAPVALLTVAADAVLPGDAVLAADAVLAGDAVLVGDAAAGGAPEFVTFEPALEAADLRVQATESPEQNAGMSLATARVVVGGGRGVGGPEGFAALEELAELLGGVVGVSRVVTSAGWRPHRQQVGQTGTKIAPDLYLACGISGAIQHMAGCQGARRIIAVNTDPDAPIMSRADYAVIADLHELIPALVAALAGRGAAPG
jgi:electron transfer flavoprotein alpha subunit